MRNAISYGVARLLVVVFLASLAGACDDAAPVRQVPWAPSLALGMESAAQRNTDLFVFFHAPWCSICRRMESEVLSDPEVVRALEGLVPVSVDIEAWPHIAKRYEVEAVPTVMVITAEGGVRAFLRGGLDRDQLLTFIARETRGAA